MKTFEPSELPINNDGSVFHLHLTPEQLADNVILVGDQDRVPLVASYFQKIEHETQNREFHAITGFYHEKRITVLSTGIGCDNIDIVMNELDALANIDLTTRTEKESHRSLNIVRIGTCGGLQPEVPIGTFIASIKSIGFDGLLNYYAGRNNVCDTHLEEAFKKHMQWNPIKGAPYVAVANRDLINRIAKDDMVRGITIACGGFYGPQGRVVRLNIEDMNQNEKIESFCYNEPGGSHLKVCNFEMESSALAGLASLLGHKAMTCCLVIANRYNKEMNTQYKNSIENLIKIVLDRI